MHIFTMSYGRNNNFQANGFWLITFCSDTFLRQCFKMNSIFYPRLHVDMGWNSFWRSILVFMHLRFHVIFSFWNLQYGWKNPWSKFILPIIKLQYLSKQTLQVFQNIFWKIIRGNWQLIIFDEEFFFDREQQIAWS